MQKNDSFMAQHFVKTQRDKNNEWYSREIKEVHNSMENLFYNTLRAGYHETALMKRLHAVLDTMPKYDASTPHVPDPNDPPPAYLYKRRKK